MVTATAQAVNITTTKVYKAVLQAWVDGKKGICLEGGTYSSKTFSALQALIFLAQTTPVKLDINIVSESIPHLKGGTIKDWFTILSERVDSNPNYNQTDHIYRRTDWNGIIQFLSADNEKALGMRRDVLYINEADTIPWDTAKELISRTNIFIILDWNPRSEFWAHEYYVKDTKWAYDHSTYLDALNVIPKGKQDDIQDLGRKDPNYQNIYELGLRGKIEGLVYPNFQQCVNLPLGAVFYGLDFGFSNDPAVLVKNVIIGGNLYSQEMFYERGLTNDDIARKMTLLGVREAIWADSAEPKSIEEIRQKGFNIQPSEKGPGSVEYGHQRVRQYFQYWTQDSLNCIKEQRNFRYLKNEKREYTDQTTHQWSHGMDARRYGVASYKMVWTQGKVVAYAGL